MKIFEGYLEKKTLYQTDDELFKYMLERHWESWAKSKGILKYQGQENSSRIT